MSFWGYYKRRKPKRVSGGIKAQSKKGQFGQNWWAKRWNEVLEGYDIGERLGRGRAYARKGQVASIDISRGLVTARVRGSMDYKVRIDIQTLEESQWEDVAKAVLARPAAAASLLAGQIPDDAEDVFDELGLSLFPRRMDLETDCTCPDWSNPCKHIAAVYLLLAEEFDRDPFLIFRLRGIERKKMLKMLGLEDKAAKRGGKKPPLYKAVTRSSRIKPLPADPDDFWRGGVDVEDAGVGVIQSRTAGGGGNGIRPGKGVAPRSRGSPKRSDAGKGHADTGNGAQAHELQEIVPAIPAAMVKQLGSFPFWRGEQNFIESMEEMYEKASGLGIRAFLGKPVRQQGHGG
ncbi:MAG: SWIM zinc finger family protein [Thaumarchaeota archaeon]|nr:SWIM zinc finger family protein [Nitrososphaerota archaeon]MDE0266090.1 SWIM zinc finger family protein [Nitrososphaerota archaeon]MDE0526833.1 SWIM zinc finger family protein [Nitrososphaerota archaeon]